MKLEVGMYVRTKWGIGKYIENYTNSQNLTWRVLEGCSNYENQEDWEDLFCDSEILKASHNIIDLIEVGDFVNGYKVIELWENNRTAEPSTLVYCKFGNGFIGFYNEEIKSIVTKEQFESIKYSLEG